MKVLSFFIFAFFISEIFAAPPRHGSLVKRGQKAVIGKIRTSQGAKDPEDQSDKKEIEKGPKDPTENTDTIKADAFIPGDATDRASSSADNGVSLWPDGILYYQLDSALPAGTQTAINEAMEHISTYTCIRFVEGTGTGNYVRFYEGSKGDCSSVLGMGGGKQDTSLGEGCGYMGTVAHEIMHVLGFNHEQNRNDRDEYVSISWANIITAAKPNFKKQSLKWALTGGQPYDYSSIMHYGKASFVTSSDLTSITCLDEEEVASDIIGQRTGLSDYDIKKVQSVYNCPSTDPDTVDEQILTTAAATTTAQSETETATTHYQTEVTESQTHYQTEEYNSYYQNGEDQGSGSGSGSQEDNWGQHSNNGGNFGNGHQNQNGHGTAKGHWGQQEGGSGQGGGWKGPGRK